MDLCRIIEKLRKELQGIDDAIFALSKVVQNQGKRRGRPPAWLKTAEKKRRGRPPGSKNKPKLEDL